MVPAPVALAFLNTGNRLGVRATAAACLPPRPSLHPKWGNFFPDANVEWGNLILDLSKYGNKFTHLLKCISLDCNLVDHRIIVRSEPDHPFTLSPNARLFPFYIFIHVLPSFNLKGLSTEFVPFPIRHNSKKFITSHDQNI